MGEYDRKQGKQESRAIADNRTGSRQLKGFVDNRILNTNHLRNTRCIQSKNRRKILQRQIHATGLNVNGIAPLDNDSHAYYHITNNLGNTVIRSGGYGSCVGLAIYRPAIGANPSVGILAHFWSGGNLNTFLNKFGNDVLDIVNRWILLTGGWNANDVITIWHGIHPLPHITPDRMGAFPILLPHAPLTISARQTASINLTTGIVGV